MDIRQQITDRIISLLEKGEHEARELWIRSSAGGFPKNASTGKPYNGANILILWAEAAEQGYPLNSWLTYKQAAALGGQVRKGEKGTLCAYFEMVKKKGQKDVPEQEAEFYPMAKPFWLFNVAQIDGLPEEMSQPVDLDALPEFSPIQEAQAILDGSGAVFKHAKGDYALYHPAKDEIFLPEPFQFTTSENYYAVALHELTHWTGHSSRLARKYGKRFGDAAYAFEELVAELGAAFVIGHVGLIDATIEHHGSYVASWIEVLKEDKTAIFTAAKAASQAYDYIMNKCYSPESQPEA